MKNWHWRPQLTVMDKVRCYRHVSFYVVADRRLTLWSWLRCPQWTVLDKALCWWGTLWIWVRCPSRTVLVKVLCYRHGCIRCWCSRSPLGPRWGHAANHDMEPTHEQNPVCLNKSLVIHVSVTLTHAQQSAALDVFHWTGDRATRKRITHSHPCHKPGFAIPKKPFKTCTLCTMKIESSAL